MSGINTAIVAPTALKLAYENTSLGSVVGVHPFNASTDGSGFYFGWESTYRTFQIRYRRRLRVRPTDTKAGGWKGWEAWKGAEYCSKSTSRGTYTKPSNTQDWDTWNMANARQSSTTNLFSANRMVYKHLYKVTPAGFGTYDGEQWQVQVRGYDEGTKKHGATATATIEVVYNPVVSYTRAVLDDDGGLRVYYTTTWNRDGNTVEVGAHNTRAASEVKGGINGTYFKIPVSRLGKNYDIGDKFKEPLTFLTADDGYPSSTVTPSLTVESKYAKYDVEPTPSLALDHANHTATYTLDEPGKGYRWLEVKAWAGWTGPDGVWRTVTPSRTVELDLVNRHAVFEYTNVPSDVVVRYRAQVVSADSDGSNPTTLQKSGTLKSNGRAFLAIGEYLAALYLGSDTPGITWQRTYEPNVETEVCAGREREVSRHGIGGKASVQVSGVIVRSPSSYKMADGARLSDWEAMKRRTGADGTIALPGGAWAKVCVTSIDMGTDPAQHAVTVSMEEVV